MSGMFVLGNTVDMVREFNDQPGRVAYLASEQARIDAQDELHVWKTYYKQAQVAGMIDQTLAQTPVGPLWARRVL